MVTKQQLEAALGTKRNWATDELLNTLNQLEDDGADLVRENWLTHTNILREGNYSLDQYLTAVKYVSLKQMGHTNQMAYSIALSNRYEKLVARGDSEQQISSHVAAYHKSNIIQKLLSQSTIPLWLMYQDEAHKAVRTLVSIMTNPDASFKTRSDSADKLLTHIKRPETAKIELDVTTRQSDGMAELSVMMRELAQKQLQALDKGADVVKVANLPVIEAEYVKLSEDK